MKVSILSAVHDEALFLDAMIDSVLAQSHTDFELLICDDGSTDGTAAIAERRSAQDARVRVVGTNDKIGKVAAFNAAFAASSGEVVLLLGGDDLLRPTALAAVVDVLGDAAPRSAACFKLRSFSTERRFDGIVAPRGDRGNRSGGTTALTRDLAAEVYPIPTGFVAEDVWLAAVVDVRADALLHDTRIILDYRIHAGNSNPRQRPFAEMSDGMHARTAPYEYLLDERPFPLTEADESRFRIVVELERRRYKGSVPLVLLCRGAGVVARLRALSMTTPRLFAIRSRLYRLFSGW